MSNLIKEKNWTRWIPKKIFLKDNECYYNKPFIHKDLYIHECNLTDEQKKIIEVKIINLEKFQQESYEKGLLQGKKESLKLDQTLTSKIQKLFVDFENSIFLCESLLFKHLLKTTLIMSAYVIGQKSSINKDLLMKNIKKLVKEDGVFLKKPKLIIHPQNKKIIEENFLDYLNTYNWELIYDINIDINDCKVRSESGNLDATIDARWQELCRLVNSEAY